MAPEQEPKGYRWDIITAEELEYAPPYFQDVPETTTEVECKLSGIWPKWLHGSFLRYVTLHPLPFTSPRNPQLKSTSPQGWRRPFHSPHLRRRLHTPSRHPASLRRPGPPPQISHDRRSRVLHESLHFKRDNARRAARRLRQELLGGTESQHASLRSPGSVFKIAWGACKSGHFVSYVMRNYEK